MAIPVLVNFCIIYQQHRKIAIFFHEVLVILKKSGIMFFLHAERDIGSLAQSVEQLAFNQLVVGSNPTRPTTLQSFSSLYSGILFFRFSKFNFTGKPALITSIIFDLGGVLYDIDTPGSQQAFKQCGITLTSDCVLGQQGSVIDRYERGLLSSAQFIEAFIELSTKSPSANDIKQACCAMLVGMPLHRLMYLKRLSLQYRLYLLSNTFEIHIEFIENQLQQVYGLSGLMDLFVKPFLSYEMGLRKPELAIYQQVIDEQSLIPEQTLFVDDRIENTHAAQQCGLQVLHKPQAEELIEALPLVLS